MNIRPEVLELFHAERDMRKLTVTFRNCSTAPKNLKHVVFKKIPIQIQFQMGRNFDLIKEESSLLKRKKLLSFFAKIDFPALHFPTLTVHGSRRLPMSLSANAVVKSEVIILWGQFVTSSTAEHCGWDVNN